MTLDELKAEQAIELSGYWEQRQERSWALEKKHHELLNDYTHIHPKNQVILKNMCLKERQAQEEKEQEELDFLRHAHAHEKAALEKEIFDRETLVNFLQSNTNKNRSRGR